MAKMPQIPQPEIGSRPENRIETELKPANVESVIQPAEAGARMAGELGERFQSLQNARDKAQADLQKKVDTITATRMAGDHAEDLRNLAGQQQKLYFDSPDKFPDAFRKAAQDLTDAAVKSAPNQQVALDVAEQYAKLDNQHLALAHSWMIGRQAQKAKSDVTGLMQAATHEAQAMVTTAGLSASIANAERVLAPLIKDVHGNPEAAVEKLRHDMAQANMEVRMGRSGADALAVMADLRDPKSIYNKYLKADEAARGLKLAKTAYDGAQTQDAFDMLNADHRSHGQLSGLFQANDAKFPSTAYSKRLEIQANMARAESDPGLSPESKAQAKAGGERLLGAIDKMQDLYFKKQPLAEQKADDRITSDLWRRNEKMFKAGPKSPNQFYADALQLRYDVLDSLHKGKISYQTYNLIEGGLQRVIPALDANEAKNTGNVHSAMGINLWTTQTARQKGNEHLNNYFASTLRSATEEQKNIVREGFIFRLANAEKSVPGKQVSAEEALKLAKDAIDSVFPQQK